MATPPPVMEANGVALTSEQKRGRAVLAVALGLWLFIALCIDVLFLALGHFSALPIICVRLVLTIGLFYAVWIGRNWARWLTVSFFAIAFLSANEARGRRASCGECRIQGRPLRQGGRGPPAACEPPFAGVPGDVGTAP